MDSPKMATVNMDPVREMFLFILGTEEVCAFILPSFGILMLLDWFPLSTINRFMAHPPF
jgi:hypothetical protein